MPRRHRCGRQRRRGQAIEAPLVGALICRLELWQRHGQRLLTSRESSGERLGVWAGRVVLLQNCWQLETVPCEASVKGNLAISTKKLHTGREDEQNHKLHVD